MSGSLRDASGGEDSATGPSERPAGEPSLVIGYIQSVFGSGTLTRADGAVVRAKAGDPVCQGDVIETAADGQIAIHFIDDTVFNLSGNSRLALNEFVCGSDGTSHAGRSMARAEASPRAPARRRRPFSPRLKHLLQAIRAALVLAGLARCTLAGMTFAILDKAQSAELTELQYFSITAHFWMTAS